MKNDATSTIGGLALVVIFASLIFAVVWVLGVDRSGVVAGYAFAGGVALGLGALLTSIIDRKKN